MADDSQQLVYKINVITEGVQGKIAEVSNSLSSVKQTMDKLGASRLEVNTTKSVENFERLSASLREVQKGIELLTRDSNAQVIDLNGIPQTMASLRLLEMQFQDLQKSIKAASLNEIFKSNQKQQITEVTSALQSQRKAIDDITKSMERQKAMSQSTYYRRRGDFDSANATLGNYNVAPKDNPYGSSWSDYVKQVQAAGSMRERIEKNIAESQAARQSKANAEANNALKIEQQRQAIAKARADQELATQKQIQAESKKAYVDEQKAMSERSKMLQRDIEERRAAEQKIVAERVKANIAESQSARQARSTAEVNNAKQLIQLRNQLQNAVNAQNTAIARGNQLEVQRHETLRQQYATARQALEARGERVSGSEPMAASQYATAESFNRQAAIASNMAWRNREITSYTNEIGKLQRAQESLYAIYKQDPSQQNLANFSATTARLKEVSEQYRVYQRSIRNTGSTLDAFMLKARSHLAWITSGFTIGALFAVPTETVDTMERIESEMASIKQVMPAIEGKDDSSIAKYNSEMQKFIGIASQYGEAVDKVMDAARSIGRMYGQGDNGIANTNLMTQQAAKMATADAFDMTTATKALESAMAQWGLQTQDTNQLTVNSNRILDVWTITAHRGAASAQDIGNAIEAAGAAAAQAGVSFEFFNALVETGVRSTGKSGNEIGQAIKSMMVSMQTDKSAKALKEWGIALDEVGTDGVKRMRSMEDVILDVSMAINSTKKDTSKLLMTLSGGKYQYSKVSNMLKDYKELLRMMGVINSDDTVGFTTKQVEVQLDTLKRKMQTIKDDMQQGIMGLAMGTNNNGWLNDLKWFAKEINNIVVGLNGMSGGARIGITRLVEGLVGLKGLDKGIKYLTTIYQEGMLLKSMQTAEQASDVKTGAVKSWLSQRYVENAKAAAAARLAKRGYVIDSKKEQVQDAANAVQKEVSANATKAQAASEVLESNVVKGNTASRVINTVEIAAASTAKRGAALATRALSSAEVFATKTIKALTLAMARNPFGFAAVAITTLATALLFEADSAGEAANKTKENSDKIQEMTAKAQEGYAQSERQGEIAEKLALKYNDVAESIKNSALSEEERKKKTEEMGEIEKTVAEILGKDAVQFDASGKMNIETIHDKAAANKEASLAELEQHKKDLEAKREQVVASNAATSAWVNDAKQRVETMKQEGKAAQILGEAYDWLYKKIGNTLVWAANTMDNLRNDAKKFIGATKEPVFGSDEGAYTGWKSKAVDVLFGVLDPFGVTTDDMRLTGQQYIDRQNDNSIEGLVNQINSNVIGYNSKEDALASIDEQISKAATDIEAIRQSGDGNNPDLTKRGETGDSNDGSGSGSSGSSSSSTPKESSEPIGLSPEGSTWIREGGVNIEDNTDRAQAMLTQAAQWYYDHTGEQLNVTSGYRDWGGHTNGEKMDYATDALDGNAELRRTFIEYLQSIGAGAVDEYSHPSDGATGGHVDVDATGYNWYTGEELGGVNTMTSGKTTKPTKSINDFHKSKYAYDEFQRQQELERESYERTKNNIANYEKINGTTFTSSIMTQQNEEGKLLSDKAALNMAKRIQSNIEAQVNAYIEQHPEISDMLAGQGTTWDALIPQEKQAIADLAGDNGGIKDLLSRQEQARQSIVKLTEAYDEQKVTVDKLHGSMTPDERDAYNKANIENRYKIDVANLGNGENFAEYIGKREAETRKLTDQFDELSKELARATDDYQKFLNAGGSAESQQGMAAKKKIDELTASVKECGNELQKVSTQDMQKVKDKTADMLSDIIVEGKSFSDVWKSLWQSLAKYAINQMLSVSNQGSIWNSIFGLFGGSGASTASTSSYSIASGGGFFGLTPLANGGWLGNYADGGAIHGAGTGKSDSILAYLANKDKFVYLSNGEYVMNAEATKRVGVENLDALNGYADGGALSPTPYVASINPATAKKATQVSGNGDTIALLKEQNKKMSDQLSLMRGMGKDGGGQMVVLNTQASSADVLKALQENPRAVQALMGQQRRAGFR